MAPESVTMSPSTMLRFHSVSVMWQRMCWTVIYVTAISIQCAFGQGDDSSDVPGTRVYYTRIDELPADIVVGNIVQAANLGNKYDQALLDTFVFEIIGGQHKSYFSMDQDIVGNLRTARMLDRDSVCANLPDCLLTLDIAVVRPQQYFQIVQVLLTLLDNNDNSPVFTEPHTTIFISENALPPVSFVLPTANDPDSGAYGIQSYSFIHSSSKFDLELIKGRDRSQDIRLRLLNRLNREEQSSYSLQVQAKDGGIPPKTGLLDIQVIVADANDNTPEFQRASYNVSMRENHPTGPGSPFLQVRATDPDQGANGEVVYSLGSFRDKFSITSNTGELSLLQPLDYETQHSYHLLVTAQDQGPDSVPVHTRVIVQVLDVNDFVPEISVNSWTNTGQVEVNENEIGAFVAHVSVEDQDLGPSGQIQCWLNDNRFSLEFMYANTYKIITDTRFDREEESLTHVTVHCTDKGEPPLSNSSVVTVHILDQNDHTPEFDQTVYTTSIPETSPIGTTVSQVSAEDQDTGINAHITYHLHANSNNMLRIDPEFGIITTNNLFDYELRERLDFYVLAVDNGVPAQTATATVSMQITDVNDEYPVFSQHMYSFGTFENQPAGTEIGTIYAKDNDTAPNDEFMFSLNDNSTFSIHPHTGIISTNRLLDREHQAVFQLVVMATDTTPPYLSSSVNLTIHIADKNDNAPKITFPRDGNSSVQVSAYSPLGYIITRIVASDADVGNNALLEFSFGRGNEDNLFEMDPLTGLVTLQSDLSKSLENMYELLVLVQDHGKLHKSAVATLYIIVNKTKEFADQINIILDKGDENIVDGLGFNEMILIIIGSVTLVVVLLLILAIICIKRCKGTRQERDSYKYMSRVDAGNVLKQTKVDLSGQDQGPVKDMYGQQDVDRIKFDREIPCDHKSPSHYPPGMDLVDKPVAVVTSTPVQTPVHTSRLCPLHGNKTSHGLLQKPGRPGGLGNKLHLSPGEKHDCHDSDSTSGCSADMSNSDSGRGPSEEGDPRQHNVHHHGNTLKAHDFQKYPGKMSMAQYLPEQINYIGNKNIAKHNTQTGCHGFKLGNLDKRTVTPTKHVKQGTPAKHYNNVPPNMQPIRSNQGFRNVTPNFRGEIKLSNLHNISQNSGYLPEKTADMSSEDAIHV